MIKRLLSLLLLVTTWMLMFSCSKLNTDSVTYKSVRKVYRYEKTDNSVIHVSTYISKHGQIMIGVENLSSEVMTVNMTKSFVVTPDGRSHTLYDPTVRVETNTVSRSSSKSRGSSVNLGAVAGAFGIGGSAGLLLSGITTGSGRSEGITNTNSTTTYFSEMPELSIAPMGFGILPKQFDVIYLLHYYGSTSQYENYTYENASEKFSVCLLYTVDYGKSWRKYEQRYYENSELKEPVFSRGKVNDAVRRILTKKKDAINEPWWIMYLGNNGYNHDASVCTGGFEDYQ